MTRKMTRQSKQKRLKRSLREQKLSLKKESFDVFFKLLKEVHATVLSTTQNIAGKPAKTFIIEETGRQWNAWLVERLKLFKDRLTYNNALIGIRLAESDIKDELFSEPNRLFGVLDVDGNMVGNDND